MYSKCSKYNPRRDTKIKEAGFEPERRQTSKTSVLKQHVWQVGPPEEGEYLEPPRNAKAANECSVGKNSRSKDRAARVRSLPGPSPLQTATV